ncbi:MAG: nickel pincer cofactor biosynthesis protein LarC [Candidatus Omnitrophota bacterium]
MKIAYFDCFSGVSGDMIIGALLDAGLSRKALERELMKLNLGKITLSTKKVMRGGLRGVKVSFKCRRNTLALDRIIHRSRLDKDIKEKSLEAFGKLEAAERGIHGKNFHLHELGEIDTLLDIVSAAAGLKLLGIEKVYASALPYSHGFIKSHHGKLPVPAPATAKLMEGVAVNFPDTEGELVTPTGIAILRTFAVSFGNIPPVRIKKLGYGAGSYNFDDTPNLLRIVVGDAQSEEADEVMVLEANIDDLNPQCYELLFERLFNKGALDAYLTPIIMKKSRPGILLSVIAQEKDIPAVSGVVFDETTTLGMRYYKTSRIKLKRKSVSIDTKFGRVRFKVGGLNGRPSVVSAEYEDLKKIAKKENISLRKLSEDMRRYTRKIY